MREHTRRLALERAGVASAEELLRREGAMAEQLDEILMPYLVGYDLWRVQPGNTLYGIARQFSTTPELILGANPGIRPENLTVGRLLVIPKNFDMVPDNVPISWELMRYTIRGLIARYPRLREDIIANTAYGRTVIRLRLGQGNRRIYYNASHHANEWITTPLVLKILETMLKANSLGEELLGVNIESLLNEVTLELVPMVNPDGVDLVTGEVTETEYEAAEKIASQFPEIPFPDGWKANLRGVDLNLNYPARWDEARQIKFDLGFVEPAPRDYVGLSPLSEQETVAMFRTTEEFDPELVIAWHTQGKEIYWKFLDLEPEGAELLGEQMARASEYTLEDVPYASSFAGYKDWFIQDFDKPGYTIEAGAGENPLPIDQLREMVEANLPIFLLGLLGNTKELQVRGVPSLVSKAEQSAQENLEQDVGMTTYEIKEASVSGLEVPRTAGNMRLMHEIQGRWG